MLILAPPLYSIKDGVSLFSPTHPPKGEISLLAQEKQNQDRFCCIDYICRKRILFWSKIPLHMLFSRGFSNTNISLKHYIFSLMSTFEEIWTIFRVTSLWPRTKGSRTQFAVDMHWSILCTALQTTISVWSEVKRKCNTDFSWSGIPLPSPHYLLPIIRWLQRQANWDRTDNHNILILQRANCIEIIVYFLFCKQISFRLPATYLQQKGKFYKQACNTANHKMILYIQSTLLSL